MSRRLYLGRLPNDAQQADVQKLFEGYGKIVDCRVMTGFGFVEFESSKDAEEIVGNFNGKPFLGQNSIIVEFAREGRRREEYPGGGGNRDGGHSSSARREAPPPRRRPTGFRVTVTGVSRDTSWQDLKDFGREAGNVSFADIDRDFPGNGILEYHTQDDADHAVKSLDGKDLRGTSVRVVHGEADGRDTRDSGRDAGRYRSPPPRRDRSRSPPPPRRREEYRRRSRSPRGNGSGGGGGASSGSRRDDRRGGEDEYRRGGEESYRSSKDDSYRRESRDDRDRGGHRESYRDDRDARDGSSSNRYPPRNGNGNGISKDDGGPPPPAHN